MGKSYDTDGDIRTKILEALGLNEKGIDGYPKRRLVDIIIRISAHSNYIDLDITELLEGGAKATYRLSLPDSTDFQVPQFVYEDKDMNI